MAVLAIELSDLLHECAHAAATLLPLGVKAISISTIGLSSTGSSTLVAAAGPLFNLVLALSLLMASAPSLPQAWRYFGWYFGTINLFSATAYLLYSAVLGSGDIAVVFNALAHPLLWRPVIAIAGLALYALSIRVSCAILRRLCSTGVIAASNVDAYCTMSYWVGGPVLMIAAIFNPVSPWFILTSGAAAGFGAMLGLLALPVLISREPPVAEPPVETLQIGWPWFAAAIASTAVFIGLFGPGLALNL
jgi:hypothetical protein